MVLQAVQRTDTHILVTHPGCYMYINSLVPRRLALADMLWICGGQRKSDDSSIPRYLKVSSGQPLSRLILIS